MNFTSFPVLGKWLQSISANCLYLDIDKSVPDSVSKYYSLRNKLSLTITHTAVKNLTFSWNISYQDRYGEVVGYDTETNSYYTSPNKPIWLMDGAVTWKLRFLRLFVEVSNILNTRYIDAGSFIQAGVWPKAGLEVRF